MSKRASTIIALFMLVASPIFASQALKPGCFTTQLADSMDFILDTNPESNTTDIDSLLIDETGVYVIDNEVRFALCRRPGGINPRNTCQRH